MPFRMRVSGVSDKGTELSISGELVEGSYMGPEAVLLCDQRGQWLHAMIAQHAIQLPKDWPVVPGDGSTLILTVAKPHAEFELNRQQLVVGRGAITFSENPVDISGSLADPAFWAIWIPLHINCEELPEPSQAWGLSSEDTNREYAERFQCHWNSGAWPYVRFELPHGRYIEIEYAAGIEHQNRVWIGATARPRVLLGYDSGHFSFPTMRIQEVLDLAARIDGHPAAPLLLLPGAYLADSDSFPFDNTRLWLRQTPGFRESHLEHILRALADNVVPELKWEFTETRGWINNWTYSQRNPASRMSILGSEDFRFIREFFRF